MCDGYTSWASRTWSTYVANDVGRNSAASTDFGCRSLMTRSRDRIVSTVMRCASTRKPCVDPNPKSSACATTACVEVHPSRIFCYGQMDLLRLAPRPQSSKPEDVLVSSQRTGKRAKTFYHFTRCSRSSRASAANPNQEQQRETSADDYVLGIFHRHHWAKVQNEGSAQGHPQRAVQETAAGHRAGGIGGNEGQTPAEIHGHIIVRKPVTLPGTTPRSST